jgi:hypothetical protein
MFVCVYACFWCNSPQWAKASSFTKITHNAASQSVGLFWTSDQLSQRPLPDNTQHSQQTNIQAPGGIRTRNLSRGGDRLRPRGRSDRC